MIKKAAGHPKILGFLLNNDLVIKGYMSRPLIREGCRSADGLEKYGKNQTGSRGINWEMDWITEVVRESPQAAVIAAGSRLGQRLLDCPSIGQLLSNPSRLQSVFEENPRTISFLTDPAILRGLMANPKALAVFQQIPPPGRLNGGSLNPSS